MSYILRYYNKFQKIPFGNKIFSKIVGRQAPYFSTINATIEHLEAGKAIVSLKQHKRIENHIGTVHAIAVCNLCEYAMGILAEATIPSHLRWLPKGINASYLAKCTGKLTATAIIRPEDFIVGEINIPISIKNESGTEVMACNIPLHISDKPAKKS